MWLIAKGAIRAARWERSCSKAGHPPECALLVKSALGFLLRSDGNSSAIALAQEIAIGRILFLEDDPAEAYGASAAGGENGAFKNSVAAGETHIQMVTNEILYTTVRADGNGRGEIVG